MIFGPPRLWGWRYNRQRRKCITATLDDPSAQQAITEGATPASPYGVRLDERVVEIPWVLGHLGAAPAGRLLDAGSTLNADWILGRPALAAREVTIITLAPEGQVRGRGAPTYVYGDLRGLPFESSSFDEITCLSTLEHVGADNSGFAPGHRESSTAGGWLRAIDEMVRVLRPGGRFYLTVPFGRPQSFSTFQQFGAAALAEARERFAPVSAEEQFFRYSDRAGWQGARMEECADAEYSALAVHAAGGHRDLPRVPRTGPVAAGAVACCRWVRR